MGTSNSRPRHRIVFLDADGVMNTRRSAGNIGGERLEPALVARVGQICRQAGAKIVLSTTWRTSKAFTQEILDALRTHANLDASEVIGRTPHRMEPSDGDYPPKEGGGDWGKLSQGTVFLARTRVSEIKDWLDANEGAVESFVTLDDMHLDRHPFISGRGVRTSMEDGLLDEHVVRAVRILRIPLGQAVPPPPVIPEQVPTVPNPSPPELLGQIRSRVAPGRTATTDTSAASGAGSGAGAGAVTAAASPPEAAGVPGGSPEGDAAADSPKPTLHRTTRFAS